MWENLFITKPGYERQGWTDSFPSETATGSIATMQCSGAGNRSFEPWDRVVKTEV